VTPQQQILDAVEARLGLITAAHGYHTTMGRIRRSTLKPFIEEDLPAVNYWPGVDAQVLKGAGWVDRELNVVLEYYDKTRDRPFADVALELAGDIAVAMVRSPLNPNVSDDPDLTLGGLVRSSQLLTITPQVGDGQSPWCGALVTYTFVYRTTASNPLTLINQ